MQCLIKLPIITKTPVVTIAYDIAAKRELSRELIGIFNIKTIIPVREVKK